MLYLLFCTMLYLLGNYDLRSNDFQGLWNNGSCIFWGFDLSCREKDDILCSVIETWILLYLKKNFSYNTLHTKCFIIFLGDYNINNLQLI